MKIQYMCMPVSENVPKDLYYRGALVKKSNMYFVQGLKKASFDTYFNAFFIDKWKKYTDIVSVQVKVKALGKGCVRLKYYDGNKECVIETKNVDSDECKELVFQKLSDLDMYDNIYLEFVAGEDGIFIETFFYDVEAYDYSDINIACCFCTYKREIELKQNVNNILEGIVYNSESYLRDRLSIYVADNGHTLEYDDFNSEYVNLIINKNYGGSAGFTRCMIESCLKTEKQYTHIILMDDDAMIEPYVVDRVAAFLSILKEKYRKKMLGGALLSKERPYMQMENGAYFSVEEDKTYIYGRNVDLRNFSDVLINNKSDNKINYNGWFFSCIPTSIINENNLPLPLFIHGDDQEYGMRNVNSFIVMNGVCVWHPDPGAKRRAYMKYYNERNHNIIFALYQKKITAQNVLKKLREECLYASLLYKYEDAWYTLRAYEDFYKGPEWFGLIDPESLNMELLKWKSYGVCQVDLKDENIIEEASINSSFQRKVMLLSNLIFPIGRKVRVYGENIEWDKIDYWNAKKICIVDSKTGEGIYVERKISELFKILFHYIKVATYIRKNHSQKYAEWMEKSENFTKYRFWEKYLG